MDNTSTEPPKDQECLDLTGDGHPATRVAAEDAEPPALGEPEPSTQDAPFALKFAIITYVVAYVTVCFLLLVEIWFNDLSLIRAVLDPSSGLQTDLAKVDPILVSALCAAIGSILGCALLDMTSFFKHVSVKRDFQSSHGWGYFFAPWLASILGLVVFAVIQSGILFFAPTSHSGIASTATATAVNRAHFGFFAIGFLVGYDWYEVSQRLSSLIRRYSPMEPSPTSKRKSIQKQIVEDEI